MANLKEIRTKIGSVKNTQKITKAMEMVAASKMRRTQKRMQADAPVRRQDPHGHWSSCIRLIRSTSIPTW